MKKRLKVYSYEEEGGEGEVQINYDYVMKEGGSYDYCKKLLQKHLKMLYFCGENLKLFKIYKDILSLKCIKVVRIRIS